MVCSCTRYLFECRLFYRNSNHSYKYNSFDFMDSIKSKTWNWYNFKCLNNWFNDRCLYYVCTNPRKLCFPINVSFISRAYSWIRGRNLFGCELRGGSKRRANDRTTKKKQIYQLQLLGQLLKLP